MGDFGINRCQIHRHHDFSAGVTLMAWANLALDVERIEIDDDGTGPKHGSEEEYDGIGRSSAGIRPTRVPGATHQILEVLWQLRDQPARSSSL